MIKKIKSLLIIAISTITMAPIIALSGSLATAYASCTGVNQNLNNGVNTALGTSGANGGSCTAPSSGSGNSLASIAKTIVNIFSLIVGIAAVIMIIYGGLRYVTSGGDSGSVGNAKNTLVYAIVGLVIVALAQTIVHFVLNAATNSQVSTS